MAAVAAGANDVFFKNDVFLPMESLDEVARFNKKLESDKEFRELAVHHLFLSRSPIYAKNYE
jgi:hypothetical protein